MKYLLNIMFQIGTRLRKIYGHTGETLWNKISGVESRLISLQVVLSGSGELPELFLTGWTMAGAKRHPRSGCSRQSTPFMELNAQVSIMSVLDTHLISDFVRNLKTQENLGGLLDDQVQLNRKVSKRPMAGSSGKRRHHPITPHFPKSPRRLWVVKPEIISELGLGS
ncbi:hypothetical protein Tco_0761513 [Tanacetum coccineum]